MLVNLVFKIGPACPASLILHCTFSFHLTPPECNSGFLILCNIYRIKQSSDSCILYEEQEM